MNKKKLAMPFLLLIGAVVMFFLRRNSKNSCETAE